MTMLLTILFVFCRIGQLGGTVSLASFGQQRQLIPSHSHPHLHPHPPFTLAADPLASHTIPSNLSEVPDPPFLGPPTDRPNTNQKIKIMIHVLRTENHILPSSDLSRLFCSPFVLCLAVRLSLSSILSSSSSSSYVVLITYCLWHCDNRHPCFGNPPPDSLLFCIDQTKTNNYNCFRLASINRIQLHSPWSRPSVLHMYAYPRSLLCVKKKKSIVSSPSFLTLALAVPLCLMFEITIHTYALLRTSFFFFSNTNCSLTLSFLSLLPSTLADGVSIEEEEKKLVSVLPANQSKEHIGEMDRGWSFTYRSHLRHFFFLYSITKSSGDFRCCHLWT